MGKRIKFLPYLLLFLLVACGGGGNSDESTNPTPGPTPLASPTPLPVYIESYAELVGMWQSKIDVTSLVEEQERIIFNDPNLIVEGNIFSNQYLYFSSDSATSFFSDFDNNPHILSGCYFITAENIPITAINGNTYSIIDNEISFATQGDILVVSNGVLSIDYTLSYVTLDEIKEQLCDLQPGDMAPVLLNSLP